MLRYYLLASALVGCSGTEAAVTVDLAVTTSASALPTVTTDLDYAVTVTELRVAVSTLQFTIEGEMHQDATANLIALPHPGHSAGGEVTGELPGDFILVWNGQAQPALGAARMIVGDYRGANFALRAATASDDLATDDALLGHAFAITGTVTKGGTTEPFHAVLDVEPDTEVIGAVFEDTVTETSSETLAVAFDPVDKVEGDTAFDGIDFFSLPRSAAALSIAPGSTEHNILRRTIQTHDHYEVVAQ